MNLSVRGVALAAAAGLAAMVSPAGPGAAQPVQKTGVSVSGVHLLLNDRPWIPHGLYQIAFEQPPTYSDDHAFWKVAARFYSPDEYRHMREFGADLVRIQVSQRGMDKGDPLSTLAYRQAVLGAIRSAREAGLIVIVSVSDEEQTGQKKPADLPGPGTRGAWTEIAPAFAHDTGVMFELFNEPRPQPSAANWIAWAAAMNDTLRFVRKLGAQNVVIADGLGVGQTLHGAPLIDDPLGQVAYGSHPYVTDQNAPQGAQTEAAWQMKFGNFAKRAPVIISEWGIGYHCDGDTPHSVMLFLQYLQKREIGLVAGTWDWPPSGFRSVRFGFPHPQTSSFIHVNGPPFCNAAGLGPGRMVQTWFQNGTPPSAIE
jgi:endoglucanase